MMRLILILLVVATTAVVHSSTADACSSGACFGGFLVPGSGANVPANLPGIRWYPMRGFDGDADPAKVTLTTVGNPEVALAFTLTRGYLVPDQPLLAGTSYIVRDHNVCLGAAGPSATFTVGPAAPLP